MTSRANDSRAELAPAMPNAAEIGHRQFCIYIAKRYEANYDDAICDWNCVGATFRYFGRNIHIQLKVWEHSNGHNNLPDNIIVSLRLRDR